MHASGLVEHSLACVYREILERELVPSWKGSLGVQKEALFRNVGDPEVIERATKLVLHLKKVQEKLFDQMKPSLSNADDHPQLLQLVSKILIEFQKDRGYCSVVCPELFQEETINEATIKALGQDLIRKNPLLFSIDSVIDNLPPH